MRKTLLKWRAAKKAAKRSTLVEAEKTGPRRFENRSVIISGAAKGIGFACAERFASEGALVVILDIDKTNGQRAARAIGGAHFIHCDVGIRREVEAAVDIIAKKYSSIDVLINNAGIHLGKNFFDLTESDFEHVLKTNLMGAFHLTQLLGKHMIKQVQAGGAPGSVVNMASVNALLGLPDAVAYCVSKGALLQLTRASSLVLAPYGIRVNAVGPGSIGTESNTENKKEIAALTPLRRQGTPAEIADVAAFLASDAAAYISGQIIYADGGRLVTK